MDTEDLLLVRFSIVLRIGALVLRWLVAWKQLVRVGDVQAAIDGSLQSSPHAVANARGLQANIEDNFQRPLFVVLILDVVVLAVGLLFALEGPVHAKLLQHATGNQETGAVRSSVVLVPNRNAELGELSGSRLLNNHVATDGCVHDLADNLPAREAHH